MTNEKSPTQPEFQHKYDLISHPQKEMRAIKILLKDGFQCKCHKVQHGIVPSPIEGQYQKEYEMCSTFCTRAELAVHDEKLYFVQSCEAIPKKFLIENADIKPKTTLEILR